MGGRWPYSCCFLGCCRQDLFNIARSILMQLPSSFFYMRLISVYVVHPYSSIDTAAALKKLRFFLSVRSDFHMTDSQSLAVHVLASRVLMSVSVDETLLPRYVNLIIICNAYILAYNITKYNGTCENYFKWCRWMHVK